MQTEQEELTILLLESLEKSFGAEVLGQTLDSRQRLATVALCNEVSTQRAVDGRGGTYAGCGCGRNSWAQCYHHRRRRKDLHRQRVSRQRASRAGQALTINLEIFDGHKLRIRGGRFGKSVLVRCVRFVDVVVLWRCRWAVVVGWWVGDELR